MQTVPEKESLVARMAAVYTESQSCLPYQFAFQRRMPEIALLSRLHYHSYSTQSRVGDFVKKVFQTLTKPLLRKQVEYNAAVHSLLLSMSETIEDLRQQIEAMSLSQAGADGAAAAYEDNVWAHPEGVEGAPPFGWHVVSKRLNGLFLSGDEASPIPLDLQRASMTPGSGNLACFSPFRPIKSGISDYVETLLSALGGWYQIDLYHDSRYRPAPDLCGGAFFNHTFPSILFERKMASRHYQSVLYQIGNNTYHIFAYRALLRFAGITVLHDYHTGDLLNWFLKDYSTQGHSLEQELAYNYGPSQARDVMRRLHNGDSRIGMFNSEGLHLNRRIFTRSLGVIVHSRWAYDAARRNFPEDSEFLAHIPLVTPMVTPDPSARTRITEKLGIPADTLIVASFGLQSNAKRPVPVVQAFRELLERQPNAYLVFAGAVEPDQAALLEGEIASLGLKERVHITGFVSMSEFCDFIQASDICVNLRSPYLGETSAALLQLLSYGRAVIVTNIGSFAEFSDKLVIKIPPPTQGDEVKNIYDAMRVLAQDARKRAQLGQRATEYVAQEHSPENCARLYAEFTATVLASPSAKRKIIADYVGRAAAYTQINDPERYFQEYAEKIEALDFAP